MVGVSWVYKFIQLIRWCQLALSSKFILYLSSLYNPSFFTDKSFFSTINTLWINIYEICFPQKYIINSKKSGGIQSAKLQLLFSSKCRLEPAECIFPFGKVNMRTRLGLFLSCPVYSGNTKYNTIQQAGRGSSRRI